MKLKLATTVKTVRVRCTELRDVHSGKTILTEEEEIEVLDIKRLYSTNVTDLPPDHWALDWLINELKGGNK